MNARDLLSTEEQDIDAFDSFLVALLIIVVLVLAVYACGALALIFLS